MKTKSFINRRNIISSAILGTTLLLSAQSIQAATVTGTIGVSITLTSACIVNGGPIPTDLSFGNINFGVQTTFFTQADAALQSDGNNVTIECTPGTTATAKLTEGVNDANATGGHKFAMANGTKYVSYDLFKEAARTTVISKGDTIFTGVNDGTQQIFNLYGRAYGADGLTAGTYNDTLTVELSF